MLGFGISKNLLCVSRLVQHICSPFIEAFTADFGCRGDGGVNIGWNAQPPL